MSRDPGVWPIRTRLRDTDSGRPATFFLPLPGSLAAPLLET